MKYGTLKESDNKAKQSLINSICAGHIRLHDGKRVEGVVAGAAISNEVKQAINKRDEVRDAVCQRANSFQR